MQSFWIILDHTMYDHILSHNGKIYFISKISLYYLQGKKVVFSFHHFGMEAIQYKPALV